MDGAKDSSYYAAPESVVYDAVKIPRKLGIHTDYALFDSWFFTASILKTLESLHQCYLMIAPKTPRVKRNVLEGHRALHRHYSTMIFEEVVKSKNKHVSSTYTLVTVPRPQEKRVVSVKNTEKEILQNYITLATNMNAEGAIGRTGTIVTAGKSGLTRTIKNWAENLAELDYRKRSNIEVSYKIQNTVMGRTNTLNLGIRVMLFGLAVILYNVYMLVRMYQDIGVAEDGKLCHKYLSWRIDVRMWRIAIYTLSVLQISFIRYISYNDGRDEIRRYEYLRNKLKARFGTLDNYIFSGML